jgi:hypothetical protein
MHGLLLLARRVKGESCRSEERERRSKRAQRTHYRCIWQAEAERWCCAVCTFDYVNLLTTRDCQWPVASGRTVVDVVPRGNEAAERLRRTDHMRHA